MADESILDIKFTYPTSDLDNIIKQMEQGITPFGMNDRLKLEVELRRKQLRYIAADYIDEDEEDDNISLAEMHSRMTAEIEKERRKSTKQVAAFRPLTEKQAQQLRDEMSEAIVRCNPGSDYNKSDEDLYHDKEEREIVRRLAALRNVYHDPISWRAAMQTIMKGIDYSLRHDYPMGYQWAVAEFNAGRIKYSRPIPQLFIGFGSKQITDKSILMGILNGEVNVISRDDEKETFKRKKRKRGNPINVDYDIISHAEYQQSVQLHNRGIDTPMGVMLKSKAGLFDRLSMPFQFQPSPQQQQREEQLLQWDWMRDGAGREYFEKKNDIHIDHVSQLIQAVQEANDGKLTQSLATDTRQFLQSVNHPEISSTISEGVDQPLQPSERAIAVEKSILEQIRKSNQSIL